MVFEFHRINFFLASTMFRDGMTENGIFQLFTSLSCLDIYRITAKFPKEERYGLTSQIRRSVVSIPSNIAEGYGRKTTLDYIRMLYISYGSVCELETQILLAGDLDLILDPLNPWTLFSN